MRADRLVSILLWLQVRGQTSSAELAERMEVSERTIHRDMDALTTAGIPVRAVRGRHGGWLLPEEYRTAPRWLSADEVGALAVLSPATTLAALGIDDEARSAWLKLQAALPPPQRAQAALRHERIHIDASSWKPSDERLDWLALLHHAVIEGKPLWIRYVRADGSGSERVVGPLGLVARGNTWYMVATVEDQVRTYRVSRIDAAAIRVGAVTRPPDFDLAAWWESSKVALRDRVPRYPVTLRVADAALPDLRARASWARIADTGPLDEDGWRTVDVRFELERDAIAAVLALGDRCEAVAPDGLRESVRTHLRRALDRYDAG